MLRLERKKNQTVHAMIFRLLRLSLTVQGIDPFFICSRFLFRVVLAAQRADEFQSSYFKANATPDVYSICRGSFASMRMRRLYLRWRWVAHASTVRLPVAAHGLETVWRWSESASWGTAESSPHCACTYLGDLHLKFTRSPPPWPKDWEIREIHGFSLIFYEKPWIFMISQ